MSRQALRPLRSSAAFLGLSFLAACFDNRREATPALEAPDPPELVAGERLFLEQRFAWFFAANAGADPNVPLSAGDPQLDRIELDGALVAGPFAGGTFSCSACHMVDQAAELSGGGIRTYDDFAARSPITERGDGRERTPRNSPPLVNASIARAGAVLFHDDGEFAGLDDLVLETLVGRNYGWLPSQRDEAIAHVARIVREDDGGGELASEFGAVPYAALLDLAATGVPPELALPTSYRIDLAGASDAEVARAVARLIAAYTADLAFARDAGDRYVGSPYDRFLRQNALPLGPQPGEAPAAYVGRLRAAVEALDEPRFVPADPDGFASHDAPFVFGEEELAGLRTFLRGPASGRTSGAGNCAACHLPPDFTDFAFHNVGFSQEDYDGVHGPGAFALLAVPDLAARRADPDDALPPSPAHPDALGRFRSATVAGDPSRADLGLWNVFANPDLPAPQTAIREALATSLGAGPAALPEADLLPLTLGLFKTPGLRDLGHAGPYGHGGGFEALEDVLLHYLGFSGLARSGFVRNADPRLAEVALALDDLVPLASFLRALNEDYE